MLNQKESKFDLEERTKKFSVAIILFLKDWNQDALTKPIINQLTKSATSIGANYCEANGAESRQDFLHKVGICRKEARETRYWLKIIEESFPEFQNKSREFYREAEELTLIFSAIAKTTKNNK